MKKKFKDKQKALLKKITRADIKSVIHENTLFFDRLVELIPARFYLPVDEKDKPWFQGLSKAAKASAKRETRENIKKARRDRLDPEKSSATTLDRLKKNLENEKERLQNEPSGLEKKDDKVGFRAEIHEQSLTYEELRQRLREKIEALRLNRNSAGTENVSKRQEKREMHKKDMVGKKRQRSDDGVDEGAKKVQEGDSSENIEKDASEAAKELAFSFVKLGDEEGNKKKRRVSKLKELEMAKKLEEAKKDPEKGELVSKKHSWKAATSRAAGVKIHDDPKLLKQSIHKEKKKHDKNVGKWKDRIETTQKLKSERQQARSSNISERIQQKKMRKVAKREKKLMRPGFEGRKEGYINEADT